MVIVSRSMTLVRRNKLFKLRRHLGIDSVRKSKKTRSKVETSQLVVDAKEHDPAGGWGVDQTKGRLANKGIFVAR